MGAFRLLAALASGLVFGLGLSLSGRLDPARVRGFLDVAGAWNPSLAFVLGGGVQVSALGYLILRRLPRPAFFGARFVVLGNRRIDAPLLVGSALLGIGWGLAGFCPGQAVAALSTRSVPVALLVAAMLAGMTLHGLVFAARPEPKPAPTA